MKLKVLLSTKMHTCIDNKKGNIAMTIRKNPAIKLNIRS